MKNFYFLLFAALLISCKSDKKSNNQESKDAISENSKEITSCFQNYNGRLNELLTKEDITEVYNVDFSSAEMEYDKEYTPEDYQKIVYSWPSERTRTFKVGNNTMEVPRPNRIGIGSLNFYDEDEDFPKKTFTSTYKTLTPEERKKAKEAIQKELNKNDATKQEKKTSEKISNPIFSQLKFDPVEGIGDAAVWDHMDSALKVLKGKAYFDVIVDVSDDVKENKKLAKKLAVLVLEKCG